MLDRLSLARWSTASDGATDEDDEFANARPLEVAKMGDIGGVGEDHRI